MWVKENLDTNVTKNTIILQNKIIFDKERFSFKYKIIDNK